VTVISEKASSIRYSVPMLLLLTICLLFAEHRPPSEVHGGLHNRDVLIEERKGQLPREAAYLVLGVVGAIGTFPTIKSRQSKLRWNYRLSVPLSILLAWSTLSLCWSDAPAVSAKRLVVVGLMLLGAFGLTLSWTVEELIKFIAWSSGLCLTVGVVGEIINGYLNPLDASYRFGGTLTWNEQGYLCMTLVLSSICLIQTKPRARWIYGALASYGLLFLILTRSRGALVGLGISLVLYFFLVMKPVSKILAILLSSAVVLALTLIGTAPHLVDTLDRHGEGNENFTGRGPLWEELLTYVHRRPWTGYGYEAFWTDKTIDDISDDQHWDITAAHSGYIESLLTLGVIGASLHTLVLLVGFAEGVRLFRTTHEFAFFLAACSFCIYLLGGFLESMLIVKPSPISFYMAALLCLIAVRRENSAAFVPPGASRRALLALEAVASE
jgi:O-antigen ligase